jgi:hypothetical protein
MDWGRTDGRTDWRGRNIRIYLLLGEEQPNTVAFFTARPFHKALLSVRSYTRILRAQKSERKNID